MATDERRKIEIHEMTADEGYKALDGAAQHYLGMSGADFLCKLDAGEIKPSREHPQVIRVAMLAQLGRKNPGSAHISTPQVIRSGP